MTIAVYAAVRIWYDGQRELRYFVVAGFFAALAVTNELPALSLFALLARHCCGKPRGKRCWAFCRRRLVVAAAAFGDQLHRPR